MRSTVLAALLACAAFPWQGGSSRLAAAEVATNPELAVLVAQYEATVKQESQQPFDAAVAELNLKYSAAVDQVLQSALRAGKLDDAIALKKEKEDAAAGKRPPAIDDANTLPALKPLRETYHATLSRLDADRVRKLQPMKDAFARSLDGLVASWTRQGKLREATQLREQRDALISGAPLASAVPGDGKRATGRIPVKLPASNMRNSPFTIGMVSKGDTVSVTPNLVRWSGGGSRKGQYCDWRGHNPDAPLRGSALPWMALVAAVGKSEFWAKDNTLSFVVPESGTLVVFANDTVGGNDGEADIVVTVTPK